MNYYARFFSISSDLFVVTDDGGKIQRANHRWGPVLGFEPREIEGRHIYEFIHPEDIARIRSARDEIRRRGEYRDFESRYIHKLGNAVWVRWNGSLDRENGYFYNQGVEVRAEKGASAEESPGLPQERERAAILRQLVESSQDGFGYCDPNFRAVYLNRFLVEELGWSPGSANLYDLVSPNTRARYGSEMLPTIRSGHVSWEGEVEFRNLRTGEFVPIWQKAFYSLDARGQPQYLAFFANDLRAKRRAEAAIFHSSKMASLGQMAAGIAHEVNNPITIIHGTAGLLKKAVQSEDRDLGKILSGLERIEKTALRISRIIRGLRMFSRSGEHDPPMPIALSEIVEETLDLCRERFRDYAIDLRIEEIPQVAIRCRPTQISQVLLNLLNNSFDAIARERERWVRIDFKTAADRVRISVTDSGPGLSEEAQHRLMEPFFTTKEPGKGTGLGLPISRGIVEEHGGKLAYVRETPNTCFAIELPCTDSRGS